MAGGRPPHAYPPFELAIVIEVFGLERSELDVTSWYTVDVCAVRPGEHPAVGGITLAVPYGLDRLGPADTVIIPGWPVEQPVPETLAAAMRGAHQRGSRVVSICSGAFVLAAAGLLDGRKAATHGQYAERPARTYPNVHVDREVLYVDDGDVLTSAGSAAGIDLCLHLIRRDHGATVANQVARRLVVPAHCDGGQSQYVERPVAVGNDTRIHDVIAWLEHTLAEPVSIAALAPVPLHSLPWRTEIRRPETPWPSSGASPADPSVCTAPPLRWPTRFGTRSGLCGSAPTGSSSTAAAPCSQ